MDPRATKDQVLAGLRAEARERRPFLPSGQQQDLAKAANAAAREAVAVVEARIRRAAHPDDIQTLLLVLRYAAAVVMIEERERVWPYDFMSFSRRAGELWHEFAGAAWSRPSRPGFEACPAPDFDIVKAAVRQDIERGFVAEADPRRPAVALESLLDLVGHVNMHVDQVFRVDGRLHAVDLKSGFGSNEKGNTERLERVANAYRLFDAESELTLVVRSLEGNAHLERLRKRGAWRIAQGEDAYVAIDAFTGAATQKLRRDIIDFEADMAPETWRRLKDAPGDLLAYLIW